MAEKTGREPSPRTTAFVCGTLLLGFLVLVFTYLLLSHRKRESPVEDDIRFELSKEDRRNSTGRRENDSDTKFW